MKNHLLVFGLSLLVTLASFAAAEQPGHLFRFDAPPEASAVALAGSFNGWSRDANPMTRVDGNVWTTRIDLPDGIHLYKFVVDGERWMNDPASDAALEQPDGHGGVNSAVLIGADPRDMPEPEPDAILAEAVRHDPTSFRDRTVISDRLLLLTVDARAMDVQRVTAHLRQGDGPWGTHELKLDNREMGLDEFGGLLSTAPGPVAYFFELTDGRATRYLASSGVVDSLESARADAFEAEMRPAFSTPDWAKHMVWYQIFPERFRNGDPGNDPGDKWFENHVRWQADWWATSPGEENIYDGEGNVWQRRYGGDIQGVLEMLPYLRRLGVNAIYFNPVFEADSMHKYDATDYRHVDDNFGVKGDLPIDGETDDPATWQWSDSDRVFLDFIDEAHRQGFKVIIDGVFNHVGRSHHAFQDVLKHGRDSPYADWFEITDWGSGGEPGEADGIQWKGWDGPSGHLPVLKRDPDHGLADGPRQHIFAVTRRWMNPDGDGDPSDGIDGWRLDVPGDVPHRFWIEWRMLVKSINPDAYITGEIWDWAHPWLEGDQFDAVMNYRFAEPAQDFFVDQDTAIPPSEFARELNKVVYGYPLQVSLVQQNLFGSHDTDRIASMFVNPDRPYDGQNRIQDNGPDYDPRKPTEQEYRRMMQAVAFQMTFLGAPMIYYGDEAGMWGPDDPSNRQPMVWQDHEPYDDSRVRFHPDIFEGYRKLIAIRGALPALRTGFYRSILAEDESGVFAFARDLEGRHVYVVINRSDEQRTANVPVNGDAPLVNLLGGDAIVLEMADTIDARPVFRLTDEASPIQPENGQAAIALGPYGTAILVAPDQLD